MRAKTTSKFLKGVCFGIVLNLFSCTSYDIVPGAERVRVLDLEPKNCLYIGEVQSIQKGKTVGTLETYMDLGTRIDLRNKAHDLGGNVLVFLNGKLSGTLPGTVLKKPLPSSKYSVVEPIKKDDKSAKPAPASEGPTTTPPDEPTEDDEEKRDMLIFIGTVFRCPSSVLNQ